MNIPELVEQICRMNGEQLTEFSEECMRKGIAVPLEFALHVSQLDAELDEEPEPTPHLRIVK
tara:strand:+ start:1958 stop:2143 length:186 start_codon:yes stop_codon:yes gene_type:complete